MGKAKMFKLRSVDTFANVYQNPHFTNPVLVNSRGEELQLKGKWQTDVFKNNNPIVLELACGKGDYTLPLAKKYPHKNFIGIDSKGARIYTGAKIALEEKLSNVAFARMRIENITNFFAASEVSEIWITFPDPFGRDRSEKKRLTGKKFLESYQQLAPKGAIVNFKTDDLPLFHFTRDSVAEHGLKTVYYQEDIYAHPLKFEDLSIKTHYEKQHLAKGRTINFMQFEL